MACGAVRSRDCDFALLVVDLPYYTYTHPPHIQSTQTHHQRLDRLLRRRFQRRHRLLLLLRIAGHGPWYQLLAAAGPALVLCFFVGWWVGFGGLRFYSLNNNNLVFFDAFKAWMNQYTHTYKHMMDQSNSMKLPAAAAAAAGALPAAR